MDIFFQKKKKTRIDGYFFSYDDAMINSTPPSPFVPFRRNLEEAWKHLTVTL